MVIKSYILLGCNVRYMAKAQITVSMDMELLTWIDSQVKDKRFANRSHGLEYAVNHLMKEDLAKIRGQGNCEVPASA